jgi:hypothetical protein
MAKCPRCKNEVTLLYNEIYECTNCDFMVRKSVYEAQFNKLEEPWFISVSKSTDLWHRDNIEDYPTIISKEYEILYSFIESGNIYGAFLKLKDMLELLIKLPVLISMNFIINKREKTSNDHALIEYMLEKSLALGDWREIANTLYTRGMCDNLIINNILKNIKKIYFNEKIDIVKWRNESIGHGALKYTNDSKFQEEISERLRIICDHFKICDKDYRQLNIYFISKNSRILLKGTKTVLNFPETGQLFLQRESSFLDTYPSISFYNGEIYFFDGYIDKKMKVSFLCYENGHKKEFIKNDISNLYHKKYKESKLISKKSKMINEFITSNQGLGERLSLENERIFNSIQGLVDYTNTKYIEEWLKGRIEIEDKGMFLLQMERGMGKTTFVKFIEKNGLDSISLNKNVIKVCYINDIYSLDIKYFNNSMNDLLRTDSDGKIIIKDLELINILDKINDTKDKFLKIISYYRDIYIKYHCKSKVIIVIDGIDELEEDDIEFLLSLLPNYKDMPKDVYILLTWRTVNELQPGLNNNIKKLTIKDSNKLVVNKTSNDNLTVLRKHIEDKFDIHSEELIKNIIRKSDYRFLYLNVIKSLHDLGYNISNISDISDQKDIILIFLHQIKLIIGEKHFEGIKRVLHIITLANEPLTINDIAYLYGDNGIFNNLLLYIYEIKGLLNINRSFRGNLIYLSNIEFRNVLIAKYKNELEEMTKEWLERLIDIISDNESNYNDGESYLISNILSCKDTSIYYKLLDENIIFNLIKYIHMMEKYKFKEYISKRYYNINDGIIKIANLIQSNGLKSKIANFVSAISLSKLGDSLFENIETDYKDAINKYDLAIQKRIEILNEYNIDYGLLMEENCINKINEDIIINIINDIANNYIDICRVYYRVGIFDKAEDYCLKGIKLQDKYLNKNISNNQMTHALTLLEFARVNEKNKKYEKAINNGMEAEKILLELIEKGYDYKVSELVLARVDECLGTTFLMKKDEEKAIKLYNSAIKRIDDISEDNLSSLNFQARIYNNIGEIFLHKNPMKNGLKYFEKSKEIYDVLENKGITCEKFDYVRLYIGIGTIKLDTGEYFESISAFELALKAMNIGVPLIDASRSLKNDFEFKIFMGMADSLFLSNNYSRSLEFYNKWIELVLKMEENYTIEDIKISLSRIKKCHIELKNNYEAEIQDKRIKRLNRLINLNKNTVSQNEFIYIFYGYKEMKKVNINCDPEKKIVIEKNMINEKFYEVDLEKYEIIKCINNKKPLSSNFSRKKKTFIIEYDVESCITCGFNKCPQKVKGKVLKISLKRLKDISITYNRIYH